MKRIVMAMVLLCLAACSEEAVVSRSKWYVGNGTDTDLYIYYSLSVVRLPAGTKCRIHSMATADFAQVYHMPNAASEFRVYREDNSALLCRWVRDSEAVGRSYFAAEYWEHETRTEDYNEYHFWTFTILPEDIAPAEEEPEKN